MCAPSAAASDAYSTNANPAAASARTSVATGGNSQTAAMTSVSRTSALRTRVIDAASLSGFGIGDPERGMNR
jgi:hypothetical protein